MIQHKDLPRDFKALGLQNELLELFIGAGHRDGDAADGRVVGGGHRQAVNIEAAAAEQAGHPGQNTALVVHKQADDPALSGFHFRTLLIS